MVTIKGKKKPVKNHNRKKKGAEGLKTSASRKKCQAKKFRRQRLKKMPDQKKFDQNILGAEGWNADDHLLWNYI